MAHQKSVLKVAYFMYQSSTNNLYQSASAIRKVSLTSFPESILQALPGGIKMELCMKTRSGYLVCLFLFCHLHSSQKVYRNGPQSCFESSMWRQATFTQHTHTRTHTPPCFHCHSTCLCEKRNSRLRPSFSPSVCLSPSPFPFPSLSLPSERTED